MSGFHPRPTHVLLFALAGWLKHEQQVVTDYLIEENRVLKDPLEGHRLRFTVDWWRLTSRRQQARVRQVLLTIRSYSRG